MNSPGRQVPNMLLEISGEITPERMMGLEIKQKQHPVVNGTGDRSKVRCCKEQYCRGSWNVRSMNQGKLEVVKQEMARVNVDILGISELRQSGMGEFNSEDHYIYYCGQESLRRNGVAIIVNNRVRNAVLGCNELTPKKDVLFIIGDQNAKVESQETPVVPGKFGLGVQNEAGQRLIEFCQENALIIANTLFQQHKRRLYTRISPDGQHQSD